MSKNMKKMVELGKDVLIVLLFCSALYLAFQSRLMAPAEDQADWINPAQLGYDQGTGAGLGELIHPLQVCANGVGGTGDGRCVVRYNAEGSEDFFKQTAAVLMEAVSNLQGPEPISRRQWEEALTEKSSLLLDFYGALPWSFLSGWATGEASAVSATVRRVALVVEKDGVGLYFRDETSDEYYVCLAPSVNVAQLGMMIMSLRDNGAFYAFELEWGEHMDPDTVLQMETPRMTVYAVKNPLVWDEETMEQLITELGFAVSTSSFYRSGDELVARSGSDMLRLSDRGRLHYEADEGGSDHFLVSTAGNGGGHMEETELCRRIAANTLGTRSGEARLYLTGVKETGTGTEITFGYSLDGVSVCLKEGAAARFLVQNGYIAQFDLNFRSYVDSGAESAVLPPRQATAAMEALELEDGQELIMAYSDGDADQVSAGWIAAASGNAEEK